jgi:sec-independent protein translocase protein TatA
MVGVPVHVLLFLDNLGGGELLVILFFILVFFGSKKIPGLAKGLGRGLREMRNAMNDVRIDIEQAARADESAKKEEPRGRASDGKPGAPEEKAP